MSGFRSARGLGDAGDGTFTVDLSSSPFIPGATTQWSNPCDPTLGVMTAACAAMAPNPNASNWIGATPQEQAQALQDLSELTSDVLNSPTTPTPKPTDYTPWIIGGAVGLFALLVFAGGHH